MGIALYLIWTSPAAKEQKTKAVSFYAVQLVLNFFWSYIFFSLHEPGWALVEIGLLWIFILLTIFSFAAINKKAAWLLVPYISWVSFAAVLNYTIWTLNK
jgi:tryptophan-rich sensory protein